MLPPSWVADGHKRLNNQVTRLEWVRQEHCMYTYMRKTWMVHIEDWAVRAEWLGRLILNNLCKHLTKHLKLSQAIQEPMVPLISE